MAKGQHQHSQGATAHLGFEAKLWLAADTATRASANRNCAATWRDLRTAQDHRSNNMDAAEYKHVVLGLIFLKYISDTFEEHRAKLIQGSTRASRVGVGAPADQYAGANPEDPDEYKAENVFWVPADARWSHLQASASFAWVQHFIHHLAPQDMAGFVLADGSMSSNQSREGDIRRALIEADLVDCMVALPNQLFNSTPIPVCLWFLAKNKAAAVNHGFAVLTPPKVPWSFLQDALTRPDVPDHLGQMADGGAYPAVRPEVIGAMQVALPNETKILEAFPRNCAPLFEQAEANRTQSRTLATLRNTLLPKLLSGALGVPPTSCPAPGSAKPADRAGAGR
jgi:hypothetical protein